MMTEQTYTLNEAAGLLGVREDDLGALLPDIGLGRDGHTPPVLTAAELHRLTRVLDRVRAMHRGEDPYSPS